MSTLKIMLDTPLAAGQLDSILRISGTGSGGASYAEDISSIAKMFDGFAQGSYGGGSYINLQTDAVRGVQTLTVTGTTTAAEVVVINGVTLTAVASNPTNAQWVASTVIATSCTNIANTINNSTNVALRGVVFAVATATTVVVRSVVPGTIGNSITTTETLVNGAFGAGTLAGGTNGTDKQIFAGRALA